jgi:hypothetical protein
MSTDVHRCPQMSTAMQNAKVADSLWFILCCPKLDYTWLYHIIPVYRIPQIHWLNLVIYSIILGYTRHHCPKIEP